MAMPRAMLSRIRSVCNFHSTIKRQLTRNSPRLFFKTNYATAAQWKTSSSAVQNVHKNDDSPMLHVTWSDNTSSRFPFVYLRDNCQCPECFHESSLQRNYDSIAHLNMEIQPERVDVLQKGKQISLTWPDKHISVFNSQWLHARRLLEEKDMRERPSSLRKEGVIFWNAERLNGRIPRHDFQEIVDDDLKLYEWLYSLHSFGIALVTNVPVEPGQVDKLSSRIGFVKTTHYGHGFVVHAKFDANNLAYTSHNLPLHIDLPTYDYPPGAQLLHCIEQATGEGGANQFVDGFYIAEVLKEEDPETFELMATTRFQFVDIGTDVFGDFHQKYTRRVIELDENEQIVRFIFNNHVRDSVMAFSPEKAVQLYEAWLKVGRMLRHPSNQIDYKLSPGEMISFNNTRVLHGRSAFRVTEKSSRFLQGVYLDWDLIYSRMRVLAKHFNIPFGI